MKVFSAEQMRQLDAVTQKDYDISGYALMQEAGKAIAHLTEMKFHPMRICVVCGKGNNAGDGFVIAREFHNMGRAVSVITLASPEDYACAAAEAWQALQQCDIPVTTIQNLEQELGNAEIIIDAILGTGISGAARGDYARAIEAVNESGKPVVAVDVPSGLRDGLIPGQDPGPIVRASLTPTIGSMKQMLLSWPGFPNAGHIKILPIQFPPEILNDAGISLNWAPIKHCRRWLPGRPADSNKGTFGHVGIIGGAAPYAGATILAARGALRTGCGLATIYTLESLNGIFKTALPEATSVILPSGNKDFFDGIAGEAISSQLKPHSILCVGPGLGLNPATEDFLWALIKHWKGPLLLDADGLTILSQGLLGLIGGRENTIITPHPGEMARLTNLTVAEVQTNRVAIAQEFATRHGITVLLKGTGTIVARPDGQAWIVPGAEPALAKGGTGDVLSGVISSLAAQGMSVDQAAIAAATFHLEAGHHAARRLGARGVLASDVADEIPKVMDA